jgi:NAD dependent epimerase/dehydratase family enzyme
MTVWVIAGAGGFMGRYLVRAFRAKGDRIRTVGRAGADAGWDDPIALARVLDGADVLLNLAGRSVNCRYTEANRREIWNRGCARHGCSATRRAVRAALRGSG